MIAELGLFCLCLALGLSVLQSALPLAGAHRGDAAWMALARPLAFWQALAVGLAFVLLAACFVRSDFSVLYVASNSSAALPLAYRVAAVWGGHEGSLLLWVLMLSLWTVAVARWSRALPLQFVARVIGVMGLVSLGFLLFMLLTSNPFERLLPAATDGRDLNPLLQDPGMVIHPPMLYMGYVGFSVAFSFAIAALIGGHLDAAWARWTRPWTTAAWVFLTFGIGLGSWWAYNELGWGGWWFWDPVENASFMPWLAGTALIHSLAVSEKRGAFKAWTVWLAIAAFALSLLGTFLVRSGVLSSVHAFATDPRRGLFILILLVAVVGTSLLLFAWRAPKIGLGQRFGVLSRESLLLVNNMMLAAACAAVLLGTLYPLFLDALGLGKISVGPPYFDTVMAMLMAPLVLVMGFGPLARWKQDDASALWRRLSWAALAAPLAALGVGLAVGRVSAVATGGLAMAFWIVFSLVADLHQRLLPAGARLGQMVARARQLTPATVGMMGAHLGVAAFAFGVAMVKTYEVERDVRLAPGDSTEMAGYHFRLQGLREVHGPNFAAVQARVDISAGGRPVATVYPEKRVYRADGNPMTEAGVARSALRDLYVSMGEALPDGTWIVRVQHKPFIVWIWGGCLLMMAGGVLAICDRRYRKAPSARAPSVLGATGEGAA